MSAVDTARSGPRSSLVRIDGIPPELAQQNQWVTWKHEPVVGKAKTTKVPFSVRGGLASTTDPSTWGSFEAALTSLTAPGNTHDGLGFVVSDRDEWVGVDIDHCLAPDGDPEPWAAEIVARLDSRTERTPSGDGLRVWVRGKWSAQRHKVAEGRGAIEVYDHSRYFTVTGNPLEGTRAAIEPRQDALDWLASRFFAPKSPPVEQRATVAPSAPLPGDYETLRLARAAKNGDRFSALYDRGDLASHDNDHSKADLALCSQLAFWTGADATRIDGLFRQSALMREKWDERRGTATYGERTIEKALARVTDTYTPRGSAGAPSVPTTTPAGDYLAQGEIATSEPPEEFIPSPPLEWTGQGTNPRRFRPLSLAELRAETPTAIEWLWEGFIPRGSLILLSGLMKGGKSTFAYAMISAIAAGRPFLGRPTKQTKTLILAVEEHGREALRRLERFGAPDDALTIHRGPLTLEDLPDVRQFVSAIGVGLVVIDTWLPFADIADENSNAEITRKIAPVLAFVRETNCTVLLVVHDRKSGGDDGTSIRGAGALLGTADQALLLTRRSGGAWNQRLLKVIGRFEESPASTNIELNDSEYIALGSTRDLAIATNRETVLGALTTVPQTVDEITKRANLSEKIVRATLAGLGTGVERTGGIVRGGVLKAVKGNPIRYSIPDSFPSQSTLGVGEGTNPELGEEFLA